MLHTYNIYVYIHICISHGRLGFESVWGVLGLNMSSGVKDFT